MILNFGWRRLLLLLILLPTPLRLIKFKKIDKAQLVNNTPYENNIQKINQSEVVEHEIENYEAIREMYPYEFFIKRSCC